MIAYISGKREHSNDRVAIFDESSIVQTPALAIMSNFRADELSSMNIEDSLQSYIDDRDYTRVALSAPEEICRIVEQLKQANLNLPKLYNFNTNASAMKPFTYQEVIYSFNHTGLDTNTFEQIASSFKSNYKSSSYMAYVHIDLENKMIRTVSTNECFYIDFDKKSIYKSIKNVGRGNLNTNINIKHIRDKTELKFYHFSRDEATATSV